MLSEGAPLAWWHCVHDSMVRWNAHVSKISDMGLGHKQHRVGTIETPPQHGAVVGVCKRKKCMRDSDGSVCTHVCTRGPTWCWNECEHQKCNKVRDGDTNVIMRQCNKCAIVTGGVRRMVRACVCTCSFVAESNDGNGRLYCNTI